MRFRYLHQNGWKTRHYVFDDGELTNNIPLDGQRVQVESIAYKQKGMGPLFLALITPDNKLIHITGYTDPAPTPVMLRWMTAVATINNARWIAYFLTFAMALVSGCILYHFSVAPLIALLANAAGAQALAAVLALVTTGLVGYALLILWRECAIPFYFIHIAGARLEDPEYLSSMFDSCRVEQRPVLNSNPSSATHPPSAAPLSVSKSRGGG